MAKGHIKEGEYIVGLFLSLESHKMALYMCARNWTEHQGGNNYLSQRIVVIHTQDDPHVDSNGLENRKKILLSITEGFRATVQDCFSD